MLKNLILWPLSVLYGIGVSIRNRLFNLGILKIREFDVPIICVGNITVGGTGKTPHTESLINELKNDYRVACLSRGYKRKTSGFVLATENSTANDIGDEPMQIKNKFPEITVAVDADRVRGIKKLMQLPEKPEVIILDDGFQHRYVKADINIMLIDYNRPIYEDHLLPPWTSPGKYSRQRQGQLCHRDQMSCEHLSHRETDHPETLEFKSLPTAFVHFHEIRGASFAGREQSSRGNAENGHTLCHRDCPTGSLRGTFKTDDRPDRSHHIPGPSQLQ